MDELNPIDDPEMARIIRPFGPLQTPKILIPYELIHEDALVIKVYAMLVEIAQGKDGREVTLPPREEFARVCGAHFQSVAKAELQLQELGWIQITNYQAPGKKERRRIIVKVIESIVTDTNRLMEIIDRGVESISGSGPVPALHNIYPVKSDGSFPPQLHALKSVCQNKDVSGLSLAQIPDQVLFELSGYASYQEIETALREVENFKPTRGEIRNIALAFRERFIFDQKGSGSLKPTRKFRLTYHGEKIEKEETNTFRETARKLLCSIYPDLFHDEKCVDRFCEELNRGGSVERGEAPQSIRNLYINVPGVIIPHQVEPHHRLVLSSQFCLEKVRCGYWGVVPSTRVSESKGTRCNDTISIKDGMKDTLKNLSLDNLSS